MNKYKFKIGDKAYGIRSIGGESWRIYDIQIVDYWVKGHNSYSGISFTHERSETNVFSAPLVFATREEAEKVFEKLQLQSSIIQAAQREINKIIYG